MSPVLKRLVFVDWVSLLAMTKDYVRLVLRPDKELELRRHPNATDELFEDQKRALSNLLTFIRDKDTHEEALLKVLEKRGGEVEECAVLAVHVFGKLAPGEVVIDKSMKNLKQMKTCPCGCKTTLNLGNTGIGNRYVWHGFPDMLVKHTTVSLLPQKSDSREEEEEELEEEDNKIPELENCVEVKTQDKSLYDYRFSKQAAAQAIVNGFAQQTTSKTYKGFVPSVGCTLTNVIIFLYDPEKDILLRRKEQMALLHDKRVLNIGAIVELWFCLNLHLFGSQLSAALCSTLQTSSVKDMFEKSNVLRYYKKSVVGVERKDLIAGTSELDPTSINMSVAFLEAGISSDFDEIIIPAESLSASSD